MLIVWQRWGIVVVGIGILSILIGMLVASVLHIEGRASAIPLGLGLLAGADITWIVGKRMNRDVERELLDPTTGQKVILRNPHTFFFVPVQWWAPVFLIAGVIFILMPLLALLGSS